MDMSISLAGLLWLDYPVMLHSSRADTCKLAPAQCEYRQGYWRYWYQADHVYGHATVYFMCEVIGVFTIGNIISTASTRSKSITSGNPTWRRGLATGRFLSYRSFHIQGLRWYSPSAGVMLLGVCGAIYFFALTLGPKPYYWPNTKTLSYGGSPPLATRSGWMAVALLPFVMVLSSKLNYVTYLTGISHKKLMVFHRWTSWAMFVLALVHTFPFIVVHIRKGDMMTQWKTSVVYWTGVAALIPQAYLNIMSIGVIRTRFYEFFKATHFLAAGFFIVFFFIHCDFRLTSWDYFIAALALYGVTYIFSFFRTVLQSLKAEAKFIRPHRCFTGRLKKLVETRYGTMAMSIDGPYGNSDTASKLASSDTAILIAGGSGTGYLLPLLQSILQENTSTAEVHVTIAVRHSDSAHWIVGELERVLESHTSNRKVTIDIHLTDDISSPQSEEKEISTDDGAEKSALRRAGPVVTGHKSITVIYGKGRPDLKGLLRKITMDAQQGTSVSVTSCGPASMGLDVRNACAEAQGRIFQEKGGAGEVWLHCEAFGW